jgi:Mlc titration factor MtfA (ptsG expression regulator)
LKREPGGDRWFTHALGGLLLVAGGGLGALLAGGRGALGGACLGMVAALGLWGLRGRRDAARSVVLAAPFPEAWRRELESRYDHYHRLPAALKRRFEDDVRVFVAEKRITGVGVEATAQLGLLVAASAVTISLGWPDFEWDRLTEVLLYPQDFDRDYSFEAEDLAGEAHAWGTVILSVPALLESFEDPDDGYHVGIHEFAHLLDAHQAHFDGMPAGMPARLGAAWEELAAREMERLRRGRSALDPYGADDPAEFLAVAVEAFFETPLAVRRRHRELYGTLAEYFAQDPAAWDDARGLALPR